MSTSDDARNPEPSIDSLVSEFRNAWHAGEGPDIEVFCRRYSSHGDKLRARLENFLLVVGRTPELGKSPLKRDSVEDKSESKDDADPGLPFHHLGDFRLIREIGRGGMGVVYEAEQLSLNRKVALKVLPEHLSFSDEAVLKFKREAEAGGRQSHPGIVAIHDVGEHERIHYIAQELVEGSVTLADRIEEYGEKKTLPFGYFRECTRIIMQAANALQHAHDSGVIHRDIKPSNILLTKKDTPKISDFGLAKVEDALALTRTGDFAGTPYYMSPEQASSRKGAIDHRTDIFSLGVTLYEMLTLSRPFEGETSQEVMKGILSSEPKDPRNLNPRIPRDLAVICLKALEKEPGRRYPSMDEFAGDLERYLGGEVILAKPADAMTRVLKRVRRNPALSAAVGAAIVAILALLVSTPLYIIKVTEERDKADRQRKAAEDAKAESDAINEFLVNMVTSPDPARDGREVRVVELLDKALDRIEKDFPGRSLLTASMRNAVGRTYSGLGLYKESKNQLAEAVDIRKELLGEQHPDTLISMTDLVKVLWRLNEISAADSLNQRVLEISQPTLGYEHVITQYAMNHSGIILHQQGNPEEAESVYRKLLEIQSRLYGVNHRDTLCTMNNIGTTLYDSNKLEDAEEIQKRTLELRRLNLGNEHPETLSSINNLAAIMEAMGRYNESKTLYHELLEMSLTVWGDKHPDTLIVMNSLGVVLNSLHEYAESEKLFLEVIDSGQVNLAKDHPIILEAMNCLTSSLTNQGKIADAEEFNRKVLEIRLRVLGKNHLDTASSMNKKGKILSSQGKHNEAKSIYEQVYVLYSQKLGEEHPSTLYVQRQLAIELKHLGKSSESEALYRKVLDTQLRVLGSRHPDTVATMFELSLQLFRQGDFSECESLDRKILDARRIIFGDEHPKTLQAIHNLAVMLQRQENFSEAEPYFRELVDLRRKLLGSEHKETLLAMNRLAIVLRRDGKLIESESLNRELLQIQTRIHGPKHVLSIQSMINLANIHKDLENYSEAEVMLKQCEEYAKESLAPNHDYSLIISTNLGTLFFTQNRFDEAEEHLLSAYLGFDKKKGRSHRHTQQLIGFLAQLYDAMNMPDKAAKFRALQKDKN